MDEDKHASQQRDIEPLQINGSTDQSMSPADRDLDVMRQDYLGPCISIKRERTTELEPLFSPTSSYHAHSARYNVTSLERVRLNSELKRLVNVNSILANIKSREDLVIDDCSSETFQPGEIPVDQETANNSNTDTHEIAVRSLKRLLSERKKSSQIPDLTDSRVNEAEEDLSSSKQVKISHPNQRCSDCGKQLPVNSRYCGCQNKPCPKCGRSFKSKKQLTRHMKKAHAPHQFSCAVCGKSFITKYTCKEHYLSSHSSRPYVCAQCGKSFGVKRYLKKHIIHSTCGKLNRVDHQAAAGISPSVDVRPERHNESTPDFVTLFLGRQQMSSDVTIKRETTKTSDIPVAITRETTKSSNRPATIIRETIKPSNHPATVMSETTKASDDPVNPSPSRRHLSRAAKEKKTASYADDEDLDSDEEGRISDEDFDPDDGDSNWLNKGHCSTNNRDVPINHQSISYEDNLYILNSQGQVENTKSPTSLQEIGQSSMSSSDSCMENNIRTPESSDLGNIEPRSLTSCEATEQSVLSQAFSTSVHHITENDSGLEDGEVVHSTPSRSRRLFAYESGDNDCPISDTDFDPDNDDSTRSAKRNMKDQLNRDLVSFSGVIDKCENYYQVFGLKQHFSQHMVVHGNRAVILDTEECLDDTKHHSDRPVSSCSDTSISSGQDNKTGRTKSLNFVQSCGVTCPSKIPIRGLRIILEKLPIRVGEMVIVNSAQDFEDIGRGSKQTPRALKIKKDASGNTETTVERCEPPEHQSRPVEMNDGERAHDISQSEGQMCDRTDNGMGNQSMCNWKFSDVCLVKQEIMDTFIRTDAETFYSHVTCKIEKPTDTCITRETEKPTDNHVCCEMEKPTNSCVISEIEKPTDSCVTSETEKVSDSSVVSEPEKSSDGCVSSETEKPSDICVTSEMEMHVSTDSFVTIKTEEPSDIGGSSEKTCFKSKTDKLPDSDVSTDPSESMIDSGRRHLTRMCKQTESVSYAVNKMSLSDDDDPADDDDDDKDWTDEGDTSDSNTKVISDAMSNRHCSKCGKHYPGNGMVHCDCQESMDNQDGDNEPIKPHETRSGPSDWGRTGIPDKPCSKCDEVFVTETYLRIHMSKVHMKGLLSHLCNTCGKRFKSKERLREHMRFHSDDRPFLCAVCGKSFKSSSCLYHHNQDVHMANGKRRKQVPLVYGCSTCGAKFSHRPALREHTNTYKGHVPKNQCFLCGRIFEGPTSLEKHLQMHQTGKPFKCNHCDASFEFAGKLEEHLVIHSSVRDKVCPQCSKGFKRDEHLRRHIKYVHSTEPPSFLCTICGKALKLKVCLDSHMAIMHPADGVERWPFKCDTCGKAFKTKGSLTIHLKRHLPVDLKHKCTLCHKQLLNAITFKNHMLCHTDEAPLECNFCGKKFKRICNLRSHLRIHTGERIFKCDICDQAFKWAHILRNHMKRHNLKQ